MLKNTCKSSARRTLPAHETGHHLTYRLSCDTYEQMLADTEQCCEICGTHARKNPGGKLYIDHDYGLGNWAVRGLLCNYCNTLIGDRPGWHLPAHLDATPYLTNPWYARRLAELGRTPHGPAEPKNGSLVVDYRGRIWGRTGSGWRQAPGRGRIISWALLVTWSGPISLTVLH
ncbi:endonuclease domain-containing protein [Nonomuraea sp. NPDC050227]|uniref:endonuclease domain-containing protein n=1 Tax=Nonomuraea sp. NPDC050227 TaxID=3364360 RepID=UPI00379D4016